MENRAYLCFGDAMLSQFDDGEIAASNSPFDVIETNSDGIGLAAGCAPSSAAVATIAVCSVTSLFHLHHLLLCVLH